MSSHLIGYISVLLTFVWGPDVFAKKIKSFTGTAKSEGFGFTKTATSSAHKEHLNLPSLALTGVRRDALSAALLIRWNGSMATSAKVDPLA